MQFKLVILFLFFIQANCFAAGFFTGDSFESTAMTGSVQVICQKPDAINFIADFSCRATSLDPVETDFFQGPANVPADTVALKSVLESGEIRRVIVPYDAVAGRSVDKINLWVQGVVQRPLLASGINNISYTMTFKGSVVAQGSFKSTVIRKPSISCSKATYYSNTMADCESPYSMCNRYFQDLIYCLPQ